MKLVLVTGATRGLGRTLALALVRSGFEVIGTGRGDGPPDDWPELEGLHYERLDLEKVESLNGFVAVVQKRYGVLYGLVNNAALGADGLLATMSESDLLRCLTVNLAGTVMLTKYAVRSMLLGGLGGRVVSVTSIAATRGFKGLSVYGATKGGLVSFSKSLAREVGPAGITVNCVSPGFLETEMTSALEETQLKRIRQRTPLGDLVTVDDVAGAVTFLMSESGKAMTGTEWIVDGGSAV